MPRTPPDAQAATTAGRSTAADTAADSTAGTATGGTGPAPKRRLARGEKRIAQLLDAAAEEFAEVGYESATTNSIAARAGASPGTLYQFFPNKEAMARALAERCAAQLRAVFGFLRDPALDGMPIGELVDRMVDPMLAFSQASPAFRPLFAGTAPPARSVASSTRARSRSWRRWSAPPRPTSPPPTGSAPPRSWCTSPRPSCRRSMARPRANRPGWQRSSRRCCTDT